MQIRVEIDSIKRNGVSKSQKPYFILNAYVTAHGFKHPQLTQFFSDVLHAPGATLQVPLVPHIDEKGNFSYLPDYKAATPVAKAAA